MDQQLTDAIALIRVGRDLLERNRMRVGYGDRFDFDELCDDLGPLLAQLEQIVEAQ